jgi:hypothetical protein
MDEILFELYDIFEQDIKKSLVAIEPEDTQSSRLF